jgi:hypothetical protein
MEYASANAPKPIAAITAMDRITPVILEKIVPRAIQVLAFATELMICFYF